jgi:hypothetical protein
MALGIWIWLHFIKAVDVHGPVLLSANMMLPLITALKAWANTAQ